MTKRMTTRLIRTMTGAALCAALAPIAHADTLFGVYAGANAWESSISGDFNSVGEAAIDTEDTLNLDDDTPTTVYVAVEHFIPLIPNVRLAFTDMSYSGDATVGAEGITFDGETFAAGSAVSSELDFSHNDVTLYYELLDNVVSLDAGVNIRVFDGEVSLASAGQDTSVALDEAVPMLYAAARADLPLTGLYVAAEGSFLSLGGNDMQDLTAKVGYTIAGGFGVEGGYRILRLKLEDINDLDSDVEADGAYAAATFHF